MNKLVILLISLLVICLSFNNTEAYTVTYFMQDNGTTTPVYNIPPSFFSDDTCSVSYQLKVSSSDIVDFSLSTRYLNPGTDLVAISNPPSISAPLSCIDIGGFITSTDNLNGFYEPSTRSVFSATNFNSWIETVYNCDPGSDETIVYRNTTWLDSNGFHPYAYLYGETCCAVACANNLNTSKVIEYLYDAYYDSNCSGTDLDHDKVTSKECNTGGTTSQMSMNEFLLIPFYSSGSGIVNVTVSDIIYSYIGNGLDGHQRAIWIFEPITNQTTEIDIDTWTSSYPAISETLDLTPETHYWLIVATQLRKASTTNNNKLWYNATDYNISIFAYEPVWNCSIYGECVNNVRSRVCNDPLGKLPDKIEYLQCSPFVDFSIYLGFEEFYTQDVFYCTKGFNCQTFVGVVDGRYPLNWSVFGTSVGYIGNPSIIARLENYVFMTEKYEPQNGSLSLMLQYIPPKPDEMIIDNVTLLATCGNKSVGSVPQISTLYNETFFVSTNITFPSSDPTVSIDWKTCPKPVKQYDTLDWISWFNIFGGLNGSCGKMYYDGTFDGDKEIKSDWKFTIRGFNNVTTSRLLCIQVFDENDVNETQNVTGENISHHLDAVIDQATNYITINTTDQCYIDGSNVMFENGANLSITTGNSSSGRWFIIKMNGTPIINPLYSPSGSVVDYFNITLENITTPGTEVILQSFNGTPLSWTIGLFNINFTITRTINLGTVEWSFYNDKKSQEWKTEKIPLTHLEIIPNNTYELLLEVNPDNRYTSDYHCVLFDNFIALAIEDPLTESECISGCFQGDYYNREWKLGHCDEHIVYNSMQCVSENIFDDVEAVRNGSVERFTPEGNGYDCIDGLYYEYDYTNNYWVHFGTENILCETVVEVDEEAEEKVKVSVLDMWFGLSMGSFDFFLSIFALTSYVILGIGVKVGKSVGWQGFIISMTVMALGASVAGLYEWYIGFTVLLACVLLFSYLASKTGEG